MIKLIMVQVILTALILADFISIEASGSARLAGRRSRLTPVTKRFFTETIGIFSHLQCLAPFLQIIGTP